jgi:hypothetical protein
MVGEAGSISFFVVGLVSLPMIHDLVKLGPISLAPTIKSVLVLLADGARNGETRDDHMEHPGHRGHLAALLCRADGRTPCLGDVKYASDKEDS